MAEKSKTVFVCTDCGYESAKWYGKCPGCGEWNTMEERLRQEEVKRGKSAKESSLPTSFGSQKVRDLELSPELRFTTGISELDRVFGGGVVTGSAVLIGGEPGIGKSTILLQMCQKAGERFRILYVSGEESKNQIKLRAERLGVNSDNLYILSETEIGTIEAVIQREKPGIVIVDSIQTLYHEDFSSLPGSVGQIRQCASVLVTLAKRENITVFIVGHINKEGAIAGPKVLEHIVDTVLYFEGDKNLSLRVLRAAKNRYGSTNEVGLFEMENDGLIELSNPSALLLSDRPEDVPGTSIVTILEGTRPILAEIQALVTGSSFGNPRRTANGIDYNRFSMLLAVIEKRLGCKFSICDVYVNVVGGLRIIETSCDLAVILACLSSLRDRPVPKDMVAIGEVGLLGELRAVKRVEERILEAKRLGFTKFLLPYSSKPKKGIEGVELIPVRNVLEAAVKTGLIDHK